MELFLKINLTLTIWFAFMLAIDYLVKEVLGKELYDWFKYLGGLVVVCLIVIWPLYAAVRIWI